MRTKNKTIDVTAATHTHKKMFNNLRDLQSPENTSLYGDLYNDTFIAPNPLPPPTAPVTAASQTPDNECAKCDSDVETSKSAHCILACGHKMHIDCFMKEFGTREMQAAKMGGHKHCSLCLKQRSDDNTLRTFIDRDVILKTLRSAYEKDTHRPVYSKPELQNGVVNEATIDAILGRRSTDLLFRKHNDYDLWRNKPEPQLVEDLLASNRTFTAIFDNLKSGLSLQDLYGVGVRTFTSLIRLGFNITHLNRSWRRVSPLWMLHELYDVVDADLFQRYTANDLLDQRVRVEELWMCNIDIASLLENGLTKRNLLSYPVGPALLVKYLGVCPATLHRLDVTRADFGKFKHWKECTKDPIVEPIYMALK